ncbi:MAG: PAS domain S-box protein [Bacteroidales bacterium]|jgi:PAS domain S-box-containing protein|nr:PAS domain S-box protein [Bacteroidales bacterium]
MNKKLIHFKSYQSLKLLILFLAISWTVLVCLSFLWNRAEIIHESNQTARIHLQTAYEKDVVFRRWNALSGGVYVPVSDSVQPNPYLVDFPERDIFTEDGKHLTLINPAYMTRQVHELEIKSINIRGHITSLHPIRKENGPDLWERKALELFELGIKEVFELDVINGQEFYRFMKPLIIEKGCLICHVKQGYIENDISGGISVSLPSYTVKKILRNDILRLGILHLVVWLIGLIALFASYIIFMRGDKKRILAEENLLLAYNQLETKVQDRTSDLIQLNETLKLSEERFRSIFESSPDAIILVNEQGLIVQSNNQIEKLFGYTKSELINKPVELLLPSSLTKEHQEHRKNFNKKPSMREMGAGIELFGKMKDEHLLHVDIMLSSTIFNGSKHVIATIRDISEKKRIEEELKQSQAHYSDLYENAPDMFVSVEAESGLVKECNNTLCIKTGYTKEEILNHPIFNLYHPDCTDDAKKAFDQFVAVGDVNNAELQLKKKNGEKIDVILNVSAERSEKGKITTSRSIWRDVSDIKSAEKEIKTKEQNYRILFDSNPIMVFVLDSKGIILDVNKSGQEHLGYSYAELVNTPVLDIFYHEDKETILKQFGLVLKNPNIIYQWKLRKVHKNGQIINVKEIAKVFIDINNNPKVLVMCENITEQIRGEEELKLSNFELMTLNKVISESSSKMDVKSLMSLAMDEALEITGLEGGTVCSITDNKRLHLMVEKNTSEATKYDLQENEISIGDCLCGNCASDRKPLILKTREEVLAYSSREAARNEDIRFHAAFPIIGKGKSLGVLCVFSYTDKKPTERSIKLVETLTNQMSLSIENANLYEQVKNQVENLENLVKERTKQLEKLNSDFAEKNENLNRMNKVFVDRELRIKELKDEVAKLKEK